MHREGRRNLAPLIAIIFISGCLATIPYAIPLASWYTIGLALLGIVAIAAARFDTDARWDGVTLWPVPLLLGVWTMSMATSGLPAVSLERSATMGLFSLVFIAVQVAAWHRRGVRAILVAVTLAIIACSIDISWQRVTGHSLIHGMVGHGARLAGSQGNSNDLAAVSVLLPLSSALVAGSTALVLYAVIAIAVSPCWIFSASRQALIGWMIAATAPFLCRTRLRRGLLFAASALVAVTLALVFVPQWQRRAIQTWRTGFAERREIIALGVEIIGQEPLTGIGPGLFGAHYRNAIAADWRLDGKALPKVGMPWVHSLPIEILCETGILGGIAMLVIVGSASKRIVRGFKLGGTTRDLAVAVGTSLVVVGVIGLVDLTFIKDWFRCAWWLMLGLAFTLQTQEKTRPPQKT
ncbi:MAG: hypothetical protein EXS03_09475 [Phycisphaerales bacterium]|nr:hypothetical protein [Phycisphaerales bacterium]